MLFLHISMPCLGRICCWQKKKHLVRLYNRGMDKTIKSLNILNLVKKLNKVTMITYQMGQISNKSKWLNVHSKYNVIDIDEDTSSQKEYNGNSSSEQEEIANEI